MTQYIEPMPIGHIETEWEMELRLLRDLADPGGCQYFPDPGLDCYFMSPPDNVLRDAQEVLRQAIGRAWHLGK